MVFFLSIEDKQMKLKNIYEEMPIDVTPEQMWQVLSVYGDVSVFHGGVEHSYKVEGSDNKAKIGGERVCNIVDMGLKIQLKERIIDYQEGVGYQYEVYEWKNFPLRKMFFKFSMRKSFDGNTLLRLDIDYKAKPAILTSIMGWKMRILIHDVLLGYKHYAQTGEKKVPLPTLRKKYKSLHAEYLQSA